MRATSPSLTVSGATATLEIDAPLVLVKDFTNDPAVPGGTVELSFLAIKPGTYTFGVPGRDAQSVQITIK